MYLDLREKPIALRARAKSRHSEETFRRDTPKYYVGHEYYKSTQASFTDLVHLWPARPRASSIICRGLVRRGLLYEYLSGSLAVDSFWYHSVLVLGLVFICASLLRRNSLILILILLIILTLFVLIFCFQLCESGFFS